MFFQIELLSLGEVEKLRSEIEDVSLDFRDGKETAGWAAARRKSNEQLTSDSFNFDWLRRKIMRNRVFRGAAIPGKVHSMRVSRYKSGMAYGAHMDNAIMPGGKCDLSFTIFLSSPDEYSGGNLIATLGDKGVPFKLRSGMMLLYPANTLHEVSKVSNGTRLVIIGWVESLVTSPEKRQILWDLTRVTHLMKTSVDTKEFDLICRCKANLSRMWSKPSA